MSDTVNNIINELKNAGYYANTNIAYSVIAANIGIPIIITGAPGSGKTSLAYAVAKMYKLPLIRIQFYEGLTDDKILYDYDYQKQLLTLEAIKPILEKKLSKDKTMQDVIDDVSSNINFYGRDFLIERPILKTINGSGRKVLLLDEIDKSDEATEYTLLEFLSEFSMSIPQYGTIQCPKDQIPIVFLTSNESRDLSGALKRRCGFLHIENKTKEEMVEILMAKASIDSDLANKIAECISQAQALKFNQTPSIAEGIQWAKYLNDNYSVDKVNGSIGLLTKNVHDQKLMSVITNKVFGVENKSVIMLGPGRKNVFDAEYDPFERFLVGKNE